jgi:next-to-BRCA1 protein 1
MEDEHFHCGICDHGDYDLCPSCVNTGIHCPGAGHWMVKRFVKNGLVVNSTTERVGPKSNPEVEQTMEQNIPGAFTKPAFVEDEPTRTCNCCVKGKPLLPIVTKFCVLTCAVMPEKEFVTCTACDDYDLCMECHVGNKHGHHPGHAFKAATSDTALPALADFLCNAGRNVRHSAVCDGCEKFIYGVRHKCLNCPDWDFCSECVKNAKYIHPRHRFVPIYEPLAEPVPCAVRHYGIYCDGPLCKEKENPSYIEGTRYKCAVCHDLDFCANCEAIPSNRHNRTHPLIKFKTPVRSVSVTTMSEDKNFRSLRWVISLPENRLLPRPFQLRLPQMLPPRSRPS